MANSDKPNGFRPVKHLNCSPWNGQFNRYYGAANLFMGDLVIHEAAGQAIGDGAYPGCDRAAADGILIGVVVGWEPDPAALDRTYYATSNSLAVFIMDDPNVILEAQANDAGLAAADVGLNCDFVVAAGNTTTGLSNMEIDGGTEATTIDEPLKLVGAVNRPDNDLATANSRWLVLINQHRLKQEAGTTGI